VGKSIKKYPTPDQAEKKLEETAWGVTKSLFPEREKLDAPALEPGFSGH
jgi:hypothetical protein